MFSMKARISPGSIARLVSSPTILALALACAPGSVRAARGASRQMDPSRSSVPASGERTLPRVIAYVHCLCGFGVGTSHDACLDEPDPNVNQVALWEERGASPITHYAIAFLVF